MTGPEHYREAEKLLTCVADLPHGDSRATDSIAEAHVHATLALAAATALSQRSEPRAMDVNSWEEAAGLWNRDA
jgi:hypothetical protein